ncbi:hypothetical protein C8R44DRAFT_753015 [Mycena epipterygia]|nr:hypothetical protein C8R44DRAFT_753015 [Mycena epipterygia]
MALPLHNPPGFVNDLTEENRKEWSHVISAFMVTDNVSPSLTPQFYDATLVDEEEVAYATVKWIGFPKQASLQVKIKYPNDAERWKYADSDRNLQDEYLEWSVKRNNDGKITRIVFCNEGPEYFEFLAEHQRDTLLALYQKLNPDVSIQLADLFTEDGSYNPRNKWNNSTTTGTIMHLIQVNSTLGAEVDLGARATVARKRKDGTLITDEQELIKCSQYGNPNRNSDPAIGIACNNAVRQQARKLTIADPVGLYINSVNWGMVEPPDGHEDDNPQEFWKWTRGSKDYYMRAEFEVPADKGYVVGDLLVNGTPLEYGAQLADNIFVSINAKTSKLSGTMEPRLCNEPPPLEETVDFETITNTSSASYQSLLHKLPALAMHLRTRR